jgi:ABC-type branched-subunit amino acid transport system substrate-binding protein
MNHFNVTFSGASSITRRSVLTTLATAAVAAPGLVRAQKADLIIGQSAPTSGFMASSMQGVLAGEQLAFDEVNKKGGINGRSIKLVILDDGFDPKRSLENARTFVEQQGAVALFGFTGTAQTAAVLPYIAEKHVPLISIYSGSPALRVKPNRYFFTTQASYADELVKMTRNLIATQNTKIAIVYQDNEFGKLLQPLAEKIITAEGGTVVASRALANTGSDAVAVAQSLAASQPQGIIMLVAGPAVVAYVKANRSTLAVPIYTLSLSVNISVLNTLGDDARGLAISRATPYPWNGITPLPKAFAAQMQRLGKPLDYDHYVGYINGRILIEGLRKAGSNITAESLTLGMEKLNKIDLGGYRLNYDAQNHHGSNFTEITIVGPGGKFIR